VSRPWDNGDPALDWEGYFIPGTGVLRNRVGATTAATLRDAENDLVEARVIELRETPRLLGSRTYDLGYLQSIHRHLFQDVYEWAGDLRTVGLEKGGEAFSPPGNIRQAMDHAAATIDELDRLRGVGPNHLAGKVAYIYDYVNFAHPFREGNGRCTREFFDLLLAERRSGLDWELVESAELYAACHEARANGNLRGLVAMFERILDDEPAYFF